MDLDYNSCILILLVKSFFYKQLLHYLKLIGIVNIYFSIKAVYSSILIKKYFDINILLPINIFTHSSLTK